MIDDDEPDYLCVGVCLPDADEAYCIGCGRPWGQREHDGLRMPNVTDGAGEDVPPGDDAPANAA